MIFPKTETEIKLYDQDFDYVIGCDEVGMGCVAGPVVACACIVPKSISTDIDLKWRETWWGRVRDSKTVNEKERGFLAENIRNSGSLYAIAELSAQEVDKLNIFQASQAVRAEAVNKLLKKVKAANVVVLIDGKFVYKIDIVPGVNVEQIAIVKGDQTVLSISAASILAKTYRDSLMPDYDLKFPGYDFSKHKGYNTAVHQKAIKALGLSPVHRRSFLKKYI